MNYDRYEFSMVSEDTLKYIFRSNGPNGEIDLLVLFSPGSNPTTYNLGFGNLLQDGEIDDKVKNRNLDRNKVLATVAFAAIDFLTKFPERQLTFFGSTAARTRLYRMAITTNLETLQKEFEIFGFTTYRGHKFLKSFSTGTNYDGFLIRKKN